MGQIYLGQFDMKVTHTPMIIMELHEYCKQNLIKVNI